MSITIFKQPENFSMLGNLSPLSFGIPAGTSAEIEIKYNVSADVPPKFKSLATLHLQGNSDGRISIDLIPLLAPIFDLHLPTGIDECIRVDVHRFVSLNIRSGSDTKEILFFVLRAGVDGEITKQEDWAIRHPLSWQPRHKSILNGQPEYFTAYCKDGIIKQRVYYAYGSQQGIVDTQFFERTVIMVSFAGVYVCRVDLGDSLRYLKSKQVELSDGTVIPGASLRLVAVELKASGHDHPTRYYPDTASSEDECFFLWENSLGGMDTFRASGVETAKIESEDRQSKPNKSTVSTYAVDSKVTYQRNTGPLDYYERLWLIDFFRSPRRYIYRRSAIRPISLTEAAVERSTAESITDYTFSYRLSDDPPYLDLSSIEVVPPDELDLQFNGANFPLPPRPTELMPVAPGEGVLIPAIVAADGVWGVLAYKNLKHDILKDCKFELDQLAEHWSRFYADDQERRQEELIRLALYGDLAIEIAAPGGTVVWNGRYAGVLTPVVFRRPANVTKEVKSYVWHRDSKNTTADLEWATSRKENIADASLLVTEKDVPASGCRFVVTATLKDGAIVSGYIDFTQGRDGLDGVVYSVATSHGTAIRAKDWKTTLQAVVTAGGKDVTDRIPEKLFSWIRTSEFTEADQSWNAKHKAAGRTVTIDHTDVDRATYFAFTIDCPDEEISGYIFNR